MNNSSKIEDIIILLVLACVFKLGVYICNFFKNINKKVYNFNYTKEAQTQSRISSFNSEGKLKYPYNFINNKC